MEKVIYTVLLLFLFAAAVMDLKEGKIPVLYIGLGFVAGILLRLFLVPLPFYEIAGGCLFGGLLLLLSFLSRQRIGAGDGMIMIVCGVFLGVVNNVLLFMIALLVAGGFGVFLILYKKRKGNSSIPFLPFLFIGYIFELLFI